MLGGAFSHALRKGPLLVPGLEVVGGLYVEEDIRPADARPTPSCAAAEAALAAVPGGAGACSTPASTSWAARTDRC